MAGQRVGRPAVPVRRVGRDVRAGPDARGGAGHPVDGGVRAERHDAAAVPGRQLRRGLAGLRLGRHDGHESDHTRWATAEHLFAFDGKLYVAAADAGGNGLLYSYDGADWRLVATLAENWVQSGAALGTSYYLGSGRDKRIWQFNGRDLVEVLAGYGPSGSRVRGLVAFRGRLYAGLAWSDSFRTVVASVDGRDWHELRPDGLTAAGAGGLGVRHLGALNGALYLAEELGRARARRLYRLAIGERLQRGGTLETARFDAELPTVDKAWRRMTVSMAAGEWAERAVAYRLDGASGWTALVSNSAAGTTTLGGDLPGRDHRAGDRAAADAHERRGQHGGGEERAGGVRAGAGRAAAWEFDVLLGGHGGRRRCGRSTARPSRSRARSLARRCGRRAGRGHGRVRRPGRRELPRVLRRPRGAVAQLPHRDGWQTRAQVTLVEA